MKFILCILVFVQLNCYSSASEVLRPRGVSLIKASLYAPGQTFRCVDGSGSIPYTYINDDYCDCRDGSDEPGTSACPNGSFHCKNIGHAAVDLRSSRVNDGVCDCCDASDEWASGAACTDICLDLGKAAREEAIRKEEELKKGHNLKLGMIEQGKNIRREKENKIAQLKHELELAEAEKSKFEDAKKLAEEPEAAALEKYREAEDAKKEAEKKIKEEANQNEAREAFDSLDTNTDGEVSVEELQKDTTYDTNRDGTVSEEEAGEEQVPPPTATTDSPASETTDPEYDTTSDSGSYEEGEEEYPEEEEDAEAGDSLPNEEIVYDDETQALVDAANEARSVFQEADKKVKEINKELMREEESLNKDFGQDDQFRVMEGNCYEYSDREYTYKLCPFDKATQAPKNGGGETRLGGWGEWVEEEGAPLYSAMKYSNGQGCWNGPNRSTRVNLVCGIENQLMGASEPSKCEYEFTFATPAACVKEGEEILHSNEQHQNQHEEL